MPEETIDLLDCALGREWQERQKAPPDLRFAAYRREYLVDPTKWTMHEPSSWVFKLNWNEFRYCEVQTSIQIAQIITNEEPGIYLFYTRSEKNIWGMPRFPLYVGISGERDTNLNRPLRDRLCEYLPTRVSQIDKRENIHQMLKLYFPHVWVAFATAGGRTGQLKAAEEKLHGFIHPCFAIRDFPVDIKKEQKAFGKI
jgi:hypothetical protein